jgi:CheY-like chemotaxis protein
VQEQPEWQLVCEALDGQEAVQKAEEMQADLILLDIGLPKLNGIEAARQIRNLVPNCKVILVSVFDDPTLAEEALNAGANGYIVKSDGSELVTAVKAVFQGQRFISRRLREHISIETEDVQAPGNHGRNEVLAPSALSRRAKVTRRHELQFYPDDAVLLERLTRFIAGALKGGNPAIVVATEPHRNRLFQKLNDQGVDVDAAIQQGVYVLWDAADTLSAFMVDDWPDSVLFFKAFNSLLEAIPKILQAEPPRVAVYSEMAGLLWAEGKKQAAIGVCQLANQLIKIHNLDIMCPYPVSKLRGESDQQAFKAIRAEHSAVYSL